MIQGISLDAVVHSTACIGKNVKIWHFVQVREHAVIGGGTVVGTGAYIGRNVRIGKNCKIGNGAQIFEGVTIGDGVFVGPNVCFTNDKYPFAVNDDGTLKGPNDWTLTGTLVEDYASIGAGAVIVCGAIIGHRSVVGAGSVVTRDVLAGVTVVGNPARLKGADKDDGK